MIFIQYVAGYIAFITSIIGLFPQIYKALITKSTQDVSMVMLINFLLCSFAWIIYGALTESIFVLLSNVLGLLSCITLILIKKIYDHSIKVEAP